MACGVLVGLKNHVRAHILRSTRSEEKGDASTKRVLWASLSRHCCNMGLSTELASVESCLTASLTVSKWISSWPRSSTRPERSRW